MRWRFSPACTLLLALLVLLPHPSQAEIRYTVSLAHPEEHLFRVTVEVSGVERALNLQMAAWNALYEIRDFSSHVQQVEAYVNGQRTEVEKLDKLTWRVQGTGTVTVKYATFWDDPGPFASQLNEEHAFINPAMILFYVPERRAESCTLLLEGVVQEWRVASAALAEDRTAGSARIVRLTAPSFDSLADDPIEASTFEEFALPDLRPPVYVVIHGNEYKKHELESALRKIVQYELKLMEGAPYEQYLFLFHIGKASGGVGGGMEHSSSSAINVPSGAGLNNVAAHEFFHLWNVKRIRPASLEPVDFTREMYSRSLWFAEGVTSTYGAYVLVRTGLWSKEEFLRDLSLQISEIENRPAELWQSAEQSSLDAWLEKYPLYNQPQRSVSYYTKGQVLGLLLDIVIRDRTGNQRSLDDLMRTMNQDFAKAGRLYADSVDIQRSAEKVSGTSLEDFFSSYVRGTRPLPYSELLPLAGLQARVTEIDRATLGFVVDHASSGLPMVRMVAAGSGAERVGLRLGAEITEWNDGPPPRHPERWVLEQRPGEELHLRVRYRGQEEALTFRLGEAREKSYQVMESPGASERARRIRGGILHGATDPVSARAR